MDPINAEVIEKATRRRWTDAENGLILNHLLKTIQDGRAIEKPNATAYYKRALLKLTLDDCTANQLKNQVKNLRNKYAKAIEWRNKTGQGVMDSEGEDSVYRVILKMCPCFDKLDEIFGSKINISPPFLHDSSTSDSNVVVEPSTSVLEIEEEDGAETILVSEIPVIEKPSRPSTSSTEKISGMKRKAPMQTGMAALAMTAKLRLEVQKAEADLSREKWEHEKFRMQNQTQLENEKFSFEKIMAEKKFTLEETQVRNNFEIAKFRIEQEMKLQLDLAKLSKS